MLHLHRKKSLIIKTAACLLVGLLILCQDSIAQIDKIEMNMFDHDSKPYYFGLTIGVISTRFQTELHPRFLADDSVYIAEPNN